MKELKKCVTCGICGGDAVLKHGDYTEDGRTYHNFPYWECTQCGEVWYDFDTMLKIERDEKMPPKEEASA
ncbi:YgiT-type zinc finger protein [uncultured Selenomonas sp.]|uniref:YgiT-type zinc finger protein n=1 Tax=uncultured Selenomonas sp. TaxID=159275 RepID=UPI0025DF902A|nr:YgiT-type zinc finger protein [uncultured Selenomonas sp.]